MYSLIQLGSAGLNYSRNQQLMFSTDKEKKKKQNKKKWFFFSIAEAFLFEWDKGFISGFWKISHIHSKKIFYAICVDVISLLMVIH